VVALPNELIAWKEVVGNQTLKVWNGNTEEKIEILELADPFPPYEMYQRKGRSREEGTASCWRSD
jgi:hypothetical protein